MYVDCIIMKVRFNNWKRLPKKPSSYPSHVPPTLLTGKRNLHDCQTLCSPNRNRNLFYLSIPRWRHAAPAGLIEAVLIDNAPRPHVAFLSAISRRSDISRSWKAAASRRWRTFSAVRRFFSARVCPAKANRRSLRVREELSSAKVSEWLVLCGEGVCGVGAVGTLSASHCAGKFLVLCSKGVTSPLSISMF